MAQLSHGREVRSAFATVDGDEPGANSTLSMRTRCSSSASASEDSTAMFETCFEDSSVDDVAIATSKTKWKRKTWMETTTATAGCDGAARLHLFGVYEYGFSHSRLPCFAALICQP